MILMVKGTSKSKRIIELDSLRGIAAISVLIFHYSYFYTLKTNGRDPFPSFDFMVGELGVDLFFMLSGFVILLTAENTQSLAEFIVARFVRLWPTFFVCCSITTVFLLIHPIDKRPDILIYLANLTLQPNLVKIISIDGVYWSLHIEVQFYMFFAFLFFVNKVKNAVMYFSVFTLFCVIYQSVLYIYKTDHFLHYYFGLIRHAPVFLAGLLCYQFYQNKKKYYLYALIINSFGVISSHWMRGYSFSLGEHYIAYWVFIGLILYNTIIGSKFFKNSVLLFFGTISYSLYLLHMMTGFSIMDYLEKKGVHSNLSVYFVVIFVIFLSTAITYFIDIPIRQPLKKYLYNIITKLQVKTS